MIGEQRAKIEIPKNFIETAQELQFQVAAEADKDRALEMAKDAMRILKTDNRPEVAGTNDVIIHTLSARILKKIIGDAYYDRKLNELIVRGSMSRLSLFVVEPEIPTIYVNVGGAIIKEPVFREDPNKGRVNGILRVPVSSVISIWPAA